MSEPCKCIKSFAYVSPMHSGHCCFFPKGQTCHQDEVNAWVKERDRRAGVVGYVTIDDPLGVDHE